MKKRGKGISLVLHPTGNKGAGDPSQAAIQLKPDGTFTLIIGSVDLGQGSTTILRQFAADELDVPIDSISVNNAAGNIAPVCTGSFASRVTLVAPHAVRIAAEDLKKQVCVWAAEQFEVDVANVVFAENKVSVKDDSASSRTPRVRSRLSTKSSPPTTDAPNRRREAPSCDHRSAQRGSPRW